MKDFSLPPLDPEFVCGPFSASCNRFLHRAEAGESIVRVAVWVYMANTS